MQTRRQFFEFLATGALGAAAVAILPDLPFVEEPKLKLRQVWRYHRAGDWWGGFVPAERIRMPELREGDHFAIEGGKGEWIALTDGWLGENGEGQVVAEPVIPKVMTLCRNT